MAPIDTLAITARRVTATWQFATYVLGPGLFDESTAAALAIRRRPRR